MKIRRMNGTIVKAKYVRHLRTLTYGPGCSNEDLDLYRLQDGTEIVCSSPSDNSLITPEEVEMTPEDTMYL